MSDPTDERQSRNRWLTIQAARIGGVVLAILGLLAGEGAIGGQSWIGYLLLAAGLFVVFIVPTRLARKWRSPGP